MPESVQEDRDWPEVIWVAVDQDGVSEIYWGDEEPEEGARRYVPEAHYREKLEARLLSDEAVEALARSSWRVNGRIKGDPDWNPHWPSDRDRKAWMEEARRDLGAVLAALQDTKTDERSSKEGNDG